MGQSIDTATVPLTDESDDELAAPAGSEQPSTEASDKPSQATSATTPSSASAVNKLMAIPHIVTTILRHARQDRPSLARLMRTNRNLYAAAGPILYHTAVIWEENIDAFFEGSFKRCFCTDCKKSMEAKWGVDHATGELNAFGELTARPHGYGKYTNPAPRAASANETAAAAEVSKPKKTKGGNNKKKNKMKKKAQQNKAVKEDAATSPLDSKDSTSNKGKYSVPHSRKPVIPGEPKSTLPLSKRQLLAHVRVLTLSGHHESACEGYAPHAAKYLVNLEILRVVEMPHTPFTTFHICENIPGGSCPLIDNLAPRKLVVRNISGLRLPFPPSWTANPKTKEIVFVLPTESAAYSGKDVS